MKWYVLRGKKTFQNIKQVFVFLSIQSGLLKGESKEQLMISQEQNLLKSAEAEDTFFQFIKGSKLSIRCLSQLSWKSWDWWRNTFTATVGST